MVNDFLFELGCEELPSGSVLNLAVALAANIKEALDKAHLQYNQIKPFATPRRLAVLITELQEEQPSQTQSRRGPAFAAAYDCQGKPTPALLGFAKSCGVDVKELIVSRTDKGEWISYDSISQAVKTSSLLPMICKQALQSLPISKPMRWGEGKDEFVRPVHWAVMLYGEQVLSTDLLGVCSDQITYGHRFHHPRAIKVTHPKHYESLLRNAYVIADFAKRRTLIIEQVQSLAAKHQATAVMPEALVDQVTSIVEWPHALIAHFNNNFLAVPAEALIASMQEHQKCFALQDADGQLLPSFITVVNIDSLNPAQVIKGNEKVMSARLSDAAFFFQQDKKQPLISHSAATAKVVFQARLGTLQDKVMRMDELMQLVTNSLPLPVELAQRAVQLSKCDLLTGMVGEFPELQGLMGYYYARHDGEKEAVALALQEQYLPRFASDKLPTSPLGLALSLVDRIDILVGVFAIGQKPSGVKDPFKLRRHALAVVRLLMAIESPLLLSALIVRSCQSYGELCQSQESQVVELKSFILERLPSFYQGQQISADLVSAVLVRQNDWLYDFDQRVQALSKFIILPEAKILSAACKRVNNLLQQAEVMQGSSKLIDEQLLAEGAEQILFSRLKTIEQASVQLYQQGKYSAILELLVSLSSPVDDYFAQVMIMVDEPTVKLNRLSLLARLQVALQGVADISLLQLSS